MKDRDIVLCVAGIFHFRYYVHRLVDLGRLQTIYFSHKASTLRELPRCARRNLPFKEYLMYLHIKALGTSSAFQRMRIYNRIWEMSCMTVFRPAAINLFLLQGNCVPMMRAAKRAGGLVIGEAVNLHPKALAERLETQSGARKTHFLDVKRRMEEIALIDHLLAPSSGVAESFIDAGFDRNRISVLPYGVEESFQGLAPSPLQPPSKQPGKIRVLVIGQISPRKGQLHLLNAVREVAKQDEISLHFVGASNPEYLETLRGQGIPFRHTPHVAHDALPSLIRDEADVVCLNSVEDGFGMVVTEALACGAPVAVSKFAGASEVVARNGGGIVYNPYDYPSTIVALRACASGSYPALQNRLPGWDSYADDLVGILDSVGSISPNLR